MKILWVDDEIETLRPHIIFLESEGIEVDPIDHPYEALRKLREGIYDIVFLDYRMPQLNGVEVLKEIKSKYPNLPVVLVTMVQDRDVMESAISRDVFDYLVKPVQPTQILAVIKKLEIQKIKSRKKGERVVDYYRRINSISPSWEGWLERGRLFFQWKIEEPKDELLKEELKEKNTEFAKWIIDRYPELIKDENVPFSFNILKKKIFPHLKSGEKVTLLIFDNFRFDQAILLSKTIPTRYRVELTPYYSIIPTATQYARNSIFSGVLPHTAENRHPEWLKDNLHEREFLQEQLLENGFPHVKFWVEKINKLDELRNQSFEAPYDLNVYVINFLDMVSHLKKEVEPLEGLIKEEEDYINLTQFILDEAKLFEKIKGELIFITTDHGWVKGEKAVIIQGGQEVSEGLRFKFGDSLRILEGDGFIIRDLEKYGLPRRARMLLVAKNYDFFVYRTSPQKFRKRYEKGLYHGGISIEEMVIPFVTLKGG
ncbi:MAG TPA: response regulator [candidate division WOR-3 bacterium]|uniref:Response regulator n=1 Tax=candidate division WOR-3 bacterium TaxID=2052148 RepID=A0A7C5E116_UNCW3|nr:response regulator [candidate division WOR-3 bacterium]